MPRIFILCMLTFFMISCNQNEGDESDLSYYEVIFPDELELYHAPLDMPSTRSMDRNRSEKQLRYVWEYIDPKEYNEIEDEGWIPVYTDDKMSIVVFRSKTHNACWTAKAKDVFNPGNVLLLDETSLDLSSESENIVMCKDGKAIEDCSEVVQDHFICKTNSD